MANIDDIYQSNFLKAADLKGMTVEATIDDVEFVDFNEGAKPVLHFSGKDKGMVLNKSNSMTLREAYGPETNAWKGQRVELFSMAVQFQGQTVQGLRVRAIKKSDGNGLDDDINF